MVGCTKFLKVCWHKQVRWLAGPETLSDTLCESRNAEYVLQKLQVPLARQAGTKQQSSSRQYNRNNRKFKARANGLDLPLDPSYKWQYDRIQVPVCSHAVSQSNPTVATLALIL